MRIDRSKKQKMDNSAGVSEIIGAILLISMVVLAVSIIAALLFGQTTPTKTPNLNFMTGVNSSKTTLYLYHNGGDTMNLGEFSVLLDGAPASTPRVASGGSQWSLGTTLIVDITGKPVPQNVQIVYNGSGSTGSVLIRESASDIVSTVNVSADQLPYLDCSAVRNWDCRFEIPPEIIIDRYEKNTSSQRISFMQHGQARGTVIGGPTNHFNFTVADNNSTIHIASPSYPMCDGGDLYHLSQGDEVGITFLQGPPAGKGDPDYFTVYGSAPQIWEMTIGSSSRIYTTLHYSANQTTSRFNGNPICHAYVSYENLDSNIDITTTSPGMVTALIVNTSHIIEGPSSTNIKLLNVRPIGNGLFLITYGANTAPIYVIGWVDAIQYYQGGNWVTQTGLGL